MFSLIRDGVTDLGITTLPSWRCQRSTIWAGVRRAFGASRDDRVLQAAALPERRPGLGVDAVLGVERGSVLLEVRVQFDLVHRRDDEGLLDQSGEVLRKEVGDADRLGAAVGVDLLEGLVRVHVRYPSSGGTGQWIRYRSMWSRPSLFSEPASKARSVESYPCSLFHSLVVMKSSPRVIC